MNCTDCTKKLTKNNVYKRADGRQNLMCKSCRKTKIYNSQKKRRYARKLRSVKLLGGKCSTCGYNNNICALHFHHTNPSTKKYNLSGTNMGYLRWELVEEELKKCVLLCANCHLELHYPQGNI